MLIVAGNGRNWLKYLRLDWPTFATVNAVRVKPLQVVQKEHPQLVAEGLGKVEPYRATLLVQPDATPKFCKSRLFHLPSEKPGGKELDRLEEQGIIEKISHSDWAAPIIPVPKTMATSESVGTTSLLLTKPSQWSNTHSPNQKTCSPHRRWTDIFQT